MRRRMLDAALRNSVFTAKNELFCTKSIEDTAVFLTNAALCNWSKLGREPPQAYQPQPT